MRREISLGIVLTGLIPAPAPGGVQITETVEVSALGGSNSFTASAILRGFDARVSLIAELGNALRVAGEDLGSYPANFSDLYVLDYVSNPCLFYNPGDSDAPPSTINNNIPNSADSAQVSFTYAAGGLSVTGLPANTILFMDNTPDNNGGMGRWIYYHNGQLEFIPEPGYQLGAETFDVMDCPIERIRIGATNFDFDFPFAPETSVVSEFAPHHLRSTIEHAFTDEYAGIYASEGFGSIQNTVRASVAAVATESNGRVEGASGPVTVTAYLRYDTVVGAPTAPDSTIDRGGMDVLWNYQVFGSPASRIQLSVGSTPYGPFLVGHPALLECAIVEGTPGTVPVRLRGVAQMTQEVTAETDHTMQLVYNNGVLLEVFPTSVPGRRIDSFVDCEAPTDLDNRHIKLFGPPGYSYTAADPNFAAFRLFVRGDVNEDGAVDQVDRTAFASAFSGQLDSNDYVEPAFELLAQFDFDGDGDVDCADWTIFATEAWTAGAEPDAIAPCDPPTWLLDASAAPGGFVSRSPDRRAFADGEVVTLTAQPAGGWRFTGWGGDVDAVGATLHLTMDADKTVTPTFEQVSNRERREAICQPPGAAESEAFGVRATPLVTRLWSVPTSESFVADSNEPIVGIRWWGISYDDLSKPHDLTPNFDLVIYSDNGGTPGTVLLETALADVERARTGRRLNIFRPAPDLIWEDRYSALLPEAFSPIAGQTYWVELTATIARPDTRWWYWAWATSTSGDGLCYVDYRRDGYSSSDRSAYDLAMCVLRAKCPGDANGDNVIDLSDLALILAAYAATEADPFWDPAADLTNDGIVDLADLAELLSQFGLGC